MQSGATEPAEAPCSARTIACPFGQEVRCPGKQCGLDVGERPFGGGRATPVRRALNTPAEILLIVTQQREEAIIAPAHRGGVAVVYWPDTRLERRTQPAVQRAISFGTAEHQQLGPVGEPGTRQYRQPSALFDRDCQAFESTSAEKPLNVAAPPNPRANLASAFSGCPPQDHLGERILVWDLVRREIPRRISLAARPSKQSQSPGNQGASQTRRAQNPNGSWRTTRRVRRTLAVQSS